MAPKSAEQWEAGDDPQSMLAMLKEQSATDRKLRLFACGCARAAWWQLRDEPCRHAVCVAERYVEGLASAADLILARGPASDARQEAMRGSIGEYAAATTAWVCCLAEFLPSHLREYLDDFVLSLAEQARLLRDIFGNPWRPVALTDLRPGDRLTMQHEPRTRLVRALSGDLVNATVLSVQGDQMRVQPAFSGPPGVWSLPPPSWLSPTAIRLAQAAYEQRLPDGLLDPVRLAITADALEEAGCQVTELLAHLRSSGPHVRGCWAIDLLLGKS